MNEPEKILCVGGPMAGESVKMGDQSIIDSSEYTLVTINNWVFYAHDEIDDSDELIKRIKYGYEQHCKAVAERNKPFDKQEEKADQLLADLQEHQNIIQCKLKVADERSKQIQDHYTASFLRSCRTCIIPSPFSEPTPLTLSYGKCYKGYLNEGMEFIVYAGTVNGEPEKSMGRISSPICIVP